MLGPWPGAPTGRTGHRLPGVCVQDDFISCNTALCTLPRFPQVCGRACSCLHFRVESWRVERDILVVGTDPRSPPCSMSFSTPSF